MDVSRLAAFDKLKIVRHLLLTITSHRAARKSSYFCCQSPRIAEYDTPRTKNAVGATDYSQPALKKTYYSFALSNHKPAAAGHRLTFFVALAVLPRDVIESKYHGPKRLRYSVEEINALTISALTASPPNEFSLASQNW
jgi:hypothetical protein